MRDFHLLEVTSTGAVFSWRPLQCPGRNGEFRGYNYELRNLDSGSHVVTREMISGTTLHLDSLAPYTLFSIQVWFANHMYNGPRTVAFKFRTLENGKPKLTLGTAFRLLVSSYHTCSLLVVAGQVAKKSTRSTI